MCFSSGGRRGLICQETLWSLFPLNVRIEINVVLLLLKPITVITIVVLASALHLGRIGRWVQRRNKKDFIQKDCQSPNFLRSNQSCRSHKNGGLGGEFFIVLSYCLLQSHDLQKDCKVLFYDPAGKETYVIYYTSSYRLG